MIKLNMIFVTSIIFLALFGSGFSKEEAKTEKRDQAITAENLDTLYSGYLEIQIALAGDDLKTAKKASSTVQKSLKKFPEELAKEVSKEEFLKILKVISDAKDIKSVRKEFFPLSKSMIAILIENEYAGKHNPAIFHCPMAFNNQGADWVQDKEEVSNPYFGKMMLRCGNKVKTIKK
jgi:Cu(I)/Ag(I) efflux system membrane fusion protein